jgi:hypothetical protein
MRAELRCFAPVLLAGFWMVLASVLHAAQVADLEWTALRLAKEGNRYVGEQAQNKVVQIRSEKSIGSIWPSIWYVVYYDPTATFKAVEVKFGAGKMMAVKRPMRLLEPVTGGHQPLDASKLTVDSDQAIKAALAEPLLSNLSIRATAAKLERGGEGLPVWKVRIWASKLRRPDEHVELGQVVLSAEDGKVLKRDLRIKRVD